MVDVAVFNGNAGVALDQTSIGVIQYTLAAAKDVTHRGTTEHDVTRICIVCGSHLVTTNLAVIDGDVGVARYFRNLTTAKDAGAHASGCTTDGDLCAIFHFTSVLFRLLVVEHRTHTAAINTAVGIFHDTGFCNGGLYRGCFRNLSADGSTIFDHNLRTGNQILIILIFDVITLIVELVVVTLDSTYLAATIDITHNPRIGTADGQFGTLHITQLSPVNSRNYGNTIQLLATSHAAGIDVTALGMRHSSV